MSVRARGAPRAPPAPVDGRGSRLSRVLISGLARNQNGGVLDVGAPGSPANRFGDPVEVIIRLLNVGAYDAVQGFIELMSEDEICKLFITNLFNGSNLCEGPYDTWGSIAKRLYHRAFEAMKVVIQDQNIHPVPVVLPDATPSGGYNDGVNYYDELKKLCGVGAPSPPEKKGTTQTPKAARKDRRFATRRSGDPPSMSGGASSSASVRRSLPFTQ